MNVVKALGVLLVGSFMATIVALPCLSAMEAYEGMDVNSQESSFFAITRQDDLTFLLGHDSGQTMKCVSIDIKSKESEVFATALDIFKFLLSPDFCYRLPKDLVCLISFNVFMMEAFYNDLFDKRGELILNPDSHVTLIKRLTEKFDINLSAQ